MYSSDLRQNGCKRPPESPETPPGSPQGPPRRSQDAPRTPLGRPRTPPDSAKTAPRRPQDAPNTGSDLQSLTLKSGARISTIAGTLTSRNLLKSLQDSIQKVIKKSFARGPWRVLAQTSGAMNGSNFWRHLGAPALARPLTSPVGPLPPHLRTPRAISSTAAKVSF